MSEDKSKLNKSYLERFHQYWFNVAKDGNLSLAAKGLLLTIKNIIPFLCGMHVILERCNSNEKEVYAALTELADKGYIKFSEIEKFLSYKPDEK